MWAENRWKMAVLMLREKSRNAMTYTPFKSQLVKMPVSPGCGTRKGGMNTAHTAHTANAANITNVANTARPCSDKHYILASCSMVTNW